MDEHRLTENEKRVLRCMYDRTKDGGEIKSAQIAGLTGLSIEAVDRALLLLQSKNMIDREPPTLTLEAVDSALKALDAEADLEAPARVLMASVLLDAADEARISALGIDANEVRKVGDRLRANGVWDAGGVDAPEDGMTFWMLVNVASGEMERRWDRERNQWLYNLAAHTRERLEKELGHLLPKKGGGQ